ncbi:hypothetical protein SAMN05421780_10555 [Flexibacter flexilis DSM 6793]|uniref:Uncharacterized protein n=1 Tax=Flexibacter flexilis DSM 6793 TaxID=927664 RepID=A0A1I1IQE8_9BACT|nr:hypothetical protein [Flexibacter flexilis]SFC38454.1 hypothetical protein SAMN05421780_10555 [Flexibacter flexilis DSM 6793]
MSCLVDIVVNQVNESSSKTDWTQIIIGVGTMIITLLTFWLARKVNQELLNNHLKVKQVEKMSELVELLNSSKIKLAFIKYNNNLNKGSAAEDDPILYNIFEIADLLHYEKKEKAL